MVFLLLAVSALPSSAATPIAGTTRSYSADFRASFGLPTDSAAMSAAAADRDVDITYGVPLSPAEASELRRRDAIAQQLGPLTTALEALPEFGGLYIDQQAGGVIDIATTGDPTALDAVTAAYLPAGAIARRHRVPFALRDLIALKDRVRADFDLWRQEGSTIASLGVDIRANRLAITIAGNNGSGQLARIAEAYGPSVLATAGDLAITSSCVDRTNCGAPIKGGLRIIGGSQGCTSALLAHGSTTTHYMLTAGHCIHDAGLSTVWTHHGISYGRGAFDGFVDPSLADVGMFIANDITPRNLTFAIYNLDIRNITGELTDSQQPVGAQICKSGATTGWLCGQVTQINRDITYRGSIRIFDMWVTSFGNDGGDSGAIMMDNGVKVGGVLSGSINSKANTIYSTIDHVEQEVQITPCFTSGC